MSNNDADDPFAVERELWARATKSDQAYSDAFIKRAQDLVAAYTCAKEAGRGDLAVFEIAGAYRVSLTTAESQLHQAQQITDKPALTQAMSRGHVGLFHVLALLDSVTGLTPDVADKVITEVLPKSAGLPPSDIRALGRKIALRIDPEGAALRRREAGARRNFSVSPADDGMAWLRLLVQAETALRIAHEVELATRADDGSGRTRDQRRADWAIDQLLGIAHAAESGSFSPPEAGYIASPAAPPAAAPVAAPAAPPAAAPVAAPAGPPAAAPVAAPAAPRAAAPTELDRQRRRPTQILVAVPVATALGLADEPGSLAEYGPIDAEHARSLITDAELRKVCVDSVTGDVVHVEDTVIRPVPDPAREKALGGDSQARAQALAEAVRAALVEMVVTPSTPPAGPEPNYRPSAALSRTVKIRSVRCDMVGCSQPASQCDDDHTVPYPDGPTSLGNLASRSRRCHRAKQRGWTPSPTPDGGTEWVSPCGLRYLSPSMHDPPPAIDADARLQPPRPPAKADAVLLPDPAEDEWPLDRLAARLLPGSLPPGEHLPPGNPTPGSSAPAVRPPDPPPPF